MLWLQQDYCMIRVVARVSDCVASSDNPYPERVVADWEFEGKKLTSMSVWPVIQEQSGSSQNHGEM